MAQNNNSSGWVGWVVFASFMMMFLGVLQAISGLVGIFKSSYYVVTQNHIVAFNVHTWGWINLIIGLVVLFAGLELLRNGALWARIVAVLLAGLSLIANITYVGAYPLWSILMGTIDVMVIYALTVHGNELAG